MPTNGMLHPYLHPAHITCRLLSTPEPCPAHAHGSLEVRLTLRIGSISGTCLCKSGGVPVDVFSRGELPNAARSIMKNYTLKSTCMVHWCPCLRQGVRRDGHFPKAMSAVAHRPPRADLYALLAVEELHSPANREVSRVKVQGLPPWVCSSVLGAI
jgi:hypothetical protein